MNKIYLLSPWCEKKYRVTPNSLNYIRFYLLDHGYDSELIDCAHYDRGLNDVISILKEDKAPIIGITSYTRERFHAYSLIKRIKNEFIDSLVVVGGRHFGSLADETLHELPEVDIVVRGEGEITFKEICDSVKNNKGFEEVLGISYKNGNDIVHNTNRPLEKNLDKFRNFDINHLPDPKTHTLTLPTKTDNRKHFFVYATRGCAFKCIFCSLTAERVRLRSINNIIREIENKIKITGVRNVKFGDSSLTIKKEFVVDLCEEIIRKKLNIMFSCYSRVDVDPEILNHMKKAGLVSVEVALESGSPRVLKSIKKNIRLDQFEKYIKETYKLRIKVFVFCMISFPDETVEDAEMTISLIKKLSEYIYLASLQVTRILPDAALFKIAKERGVVAKDFSWFEPFAETRDGSMFKLSIYSTIPLYIEGLTEQDIVKKLDEFDGMRKKDFVYMSYIVRSIKDNLRRGSLKNMSIRLFTRKTKVALLNLFSALRNSRKEKYYHSTHKRM